MTPGHPGKFSWAPRKRLPTMALRTPSNLGASRPLGTLPFTPNLHPAGTASILLVEDDDALRDVLTRHLTEGGHQVFPAATGQEGLRTASACGPSLTMALLDVRLPDIQGDELWRRLNQEVLGIRGLFISGHDLTQLPELHLSRQEIFFLPKPFPLSELDQAIHRLLATR